MLQVKEFQKLTPEVRGKSFTSLKKAVLDGVIDPLEFITKKKIIEETLEMVAKDADVKSMVMSEVAKYKAEGGATYQGAKIAISSLPKYDYSQDPTWAAIKAEMAPLEARLKAQEEKIKIATKNGVTLTDTDSGEIIAMAVPAPATESIKVSLPK